MNEIQLARFTSRYMVDENGCWLWNGNTIDSGYATFEWESESFAHRVSYIHYKGVIPHGMVIDHVCRVRHCVNPEHLEAVTQQENLRRSPISFASKDACPYGHVYEGYNVTYRKDSKGEKIWRRCRICRNKYRRQYYKNTKK